MSALAQDCRYALRSLRKAWVVTLLAVFSLSLAIGGNSVVFSMVYAFLFRTLPFENAETIHLLWQGRSGQPEDLIPFSPAEFFDYRERSKTIEQAVAFGATLVNLTEGDKPEQLVAEQVSEGLFTFLGARPLLGRTFLPEEWIRGRDQVVVLSYPFWEERFGADPEISGKTLLIDAQPYVIVGVMPRGFEIFTPNIRFWLPLVPDPDDRRLGSRTLFVFARVQDGISLRQAQGEIEAIGRQLEIDYPQQSRGYEGHLDLFQNRFPDARNQQLFFLLQGGLIFVLLIACANIANLLLARGQDRQREFAMRISLGAAKSRILRQLLTESLVLAALGGLLGLALGGAGIHILSTSLAGVMPQIFDPRLEPSVLIFTLAISFFGGVVFGLAPAVQGSRVHLSEVLKQGGRSFSGGRRRRWISQGLVTAQVAMALILLAGAGVLIESFADLQNTDLGIEAEHLLTMQLSLPATRYREDEQILHFFDEVVEALEGIPGITAATVANSLPRSPFAPAASYYVDDNPPADDQPLPSGFVLSVGPGYFETLGVGLLKGRALGVEDRAESQPVAVVSRELARRNWPGGDPLGRRLNVYGRSRLVVGVCQDVLQGFLIGTVGDQPVVYLPQSQLPQRIMNILARSPGDPMALADQARAQIEILDGNLTVGQVMTLRQFVDQFFVGAQAFSVILTFFGFLALALASVGIYGVLAYSVAQRRHEIGVRIAVGARRSNVVLLVTRRGLLLAGIGFLVGIPGVVAVTRVISSALSGISDVRISLVFGAGLILLAVSAFASYLPARRAAAVDPISALRQE